MAKRKRLVSTPSSGGGAQPARMVSRAPIADVAADAARTGAFEEMRHELSSARTEGRLVLTVPLEAINVDYLIRDRLTLDPEEMAILRDSISRRGQQTPIEIIEYPADESGPQYGLISGLRRFRALQDLSKEDPVRFGTVKALLRQPKDSSDAYIAMVEENEVRATLGFYEKAHLAVAAAEAKIFPDTRAAVSALFGALPKSKKSKVNSFVLLVETLGSAVRFPAHIPEHLGLKLVKAIKKDSDFGPALRSKLIAGSAETFSDERTLLEDALRSDHPRGSRRKTSDAAPQGVEVAPGIWLAEKKASPRAKTREVSLSGRAVTKDFLSQLQHWIASRS